MSFIDIGEAKDERETDDWIVDEFDFGTVCVRVAHVPSLVHWSMPRMSRHVWPGAKLLCNWLSKNASISLEVS